MDHKDFWYILAESHELKPGKVLARTVLNEWLAVFRDEEGRAVALQDRCLHRSAQLSKGRVEEGRLRCPYHGWVYDGSGAVTSIPAEGKNKPKVRQCAKRYEVTEEDGFVYVRLAATPSAELRPFPMPCYGKPGYRTIRLQNLFRNNVTNCAENFVDIPHTVYVHPTIFRTQRNEQLSASVKRENGAVHVDYHQEASNFGIFSWFLNPSGKEIFHRDSFYAPNVTCVEYKFGARRHLFITSQSIPVTDTETLVYTDLTYDYGIFNLFAGPVLRRQGQAIIDQDVEILGIQGKVIAKYGESFINTEPDLIHMWIESLQNELKRGGDPRALPARAGSIKFWA